MPIPSQAEPHSSRRGGRRKYAFTDQIDQRIREIYLSHPDIHERDVRRFILQHPSDIDLRKVDQVWFIDVLANGSRRSA